MTDKDNVSKWGALLRKIPSWPPANPPRAPENRAASKGRQTTRVATLGAWRGRGTEHLTPALLWTPRGPNRRMWQRGQRTVGYPHPSHGEAPPGTAPRQLAIYIEPAFSELLQPPTEDERKALEQQIRVDRGSDTPVERRFVNGRRVAVTGVLRGELAQLMESFVPTRTHHIYDSAARMALLIG